MRFWSSLAGDTWGYLTEVIIIYCVSTYNMYFLKQHMAGQNCGRLLSCPMLAGKAVAEKRRFHLL